MIRRRSDKNKSIVREEVSLGEKLFYSRGQRSEISGKFLGHDYSHVFASHLHTKAAMPALRLVSKNIVLMTFEEHQMWEFERHKLYNLPEWEWVFKLFALLKQDYYAGKYGKTTSVRRNIF
jgi:hypothetical protein